MSDTPLKKTRAPKLEIREMELEDLAAVFALGERLFTADLWPNLYRTWDEYEVVDFFSGDGDTCFVACDGDELLGFVLGSVIEKRRSAWMYGYLVWIGVDPRQGRQGVGRALVLALERRFIELGARLVLVDTELSNQRALAFFRRLGFGNEHQHVYLSANLTKHADYQRLRQKAKTAPAAKGAAKDRPVNPRGRRRVARVVPSLDSNSVGTPPDTESPAE